MQKTATAQNCSPRSMLHYIALCYITRVVQINGGPEEFSLLPMARSRGSKVVNHSWA